jgi:hypothetical protein
MNSLFATGVSYRVAAILSGVALLLAVSVLAPPPANAAPPQQAKKLTASAIQVVRTQTSETMSIPEDFRIATYEHVIEQIEKTKKFQKIYRDGDRTAESVPDLVILKFIPSAFKEGSQKEREVTTIKGGTSIKFNVQFLKKDGTVLLEKEVEGKVRFYGENLAATKNFATKVAGVVKANF